MPNYTNDDIVRMIGCPKRIIQQPKREMRAERGTIRNDMMLESEDGTNRFSVFMRRNEQFPENFTIGLRYLSREGQSFNLYRCNGPHGNHAELGFGHPHFYYHSHHMMADDLNSVILAERHATIESGYASYEDAIFYFLNYVNVDKSDIEKAFRKKELELPLDFDGDN
ncbi:MAG: hypothetical protein ACYC1M_14820 [Armatimonadota bacterium]